MGIGLGGSRRKRDVFAVADPNFSHGHMVPGIGSVGLMELLKRLSDWRSLNSCHMESML